MNVPLKNHSFLIRYPHEALSCLPLKKKKQLKTVIKKNMLNDYYGIKAILPGQWYGPVGKVLLYKLMT